MTHQHINVADLIIGLILIGAALAIALLSSRPRHDDVDTYGDDIPTKPKHPTRWQ